MRWRGPLPTLLVTTWLGCTPSPSPEPIVLSPPSAAPAGTLFAVSSTSAQPSALAPAQAPDPLAALLQAAIDAKELEPYWHVAQAPERAPLVMRRSGPLMSEPKLHKFGQPVVYVAEAELGGRPHMSLSSLIMSKDRAQVGLKYDVEGVVAEIHLVREGGAWVVAKARVVER